MNYAPLPLTASKTSNCSKYWLILAICALALAGLFSLPPVILRGPYFTDILPVELIFSTSLVLHVDLSVLVWMLAMAGFLWSLLTPRWLQSFSYGALIACAIGTLIITLSPFIGAAIPLKNNYIPVLVNLPFMLGLAVFASGILVQACITLGAYKKAKDDILSLAIYCSSIITIIAFVNFILSHMMIESFADLGAFYFYEQLFWGGGHSLQFTYTGIMLVAWLCLAKHEKIPLPFSINILRFFIIINVIALCVTPLFYLMANQLEDTTSWFTQHMRIAGGISPGVVALLLIYGAYSGKKITITPITSCLYLSILLFLIGGGFAFLIQGSNAIIPAHYHGSIVAITLSLMGLCYYALPKLGYVNLPPRLSKWQPPIYGFGQLMHISGLALMGGYGALRKAPGTSQEINTTLGKLLFFAGGSLAIIGGLLFVLIAFMAIVKKQNK